MKVVVIGNCTVDLSFQLPRFPRAGETLLADGCAMDVGGKGANQAAVIARAGAAVWFYTALGGDPESDLISSRLAYEHVNLQFLVEREGVTDRSIIYLTPSGENSIVSTHALARSITPHEAAPAVQTLEPGDILLMQGNLNQETTRYCLRQGQVQQARVVLNAAPIQYAYDTLWGFVDVAVVNEVEAAVLSGKRDPASGARAIVGKGARSVIVTLGSQGAKIIGLDYERDIRAELVEALDTTGAGDVFCGVFGAGLAMNLSTEEAAAWAVDAATLSVTRKGTQRSFPTRAELLSLFSQFRDS